MKLTSEDLLINLKQKDGYYTVKDKGYAVALDIRLSEALIREGLIREMISKIQTMRKDSGFEVMDHIQLYISGNDSLTNLLKENFREVADNTLADRLIENQIAPAFSKEWDINGEKVILGVEKIS